MEDLFLLVPVAASMIGFGLAIAQQLRVAGSIQKVAESLDFRLSNNRSALIEREWLLQGTWRGHEATIRYGRKILSNQNNASKMTVELGPVHVGVGLRREGVGDRILGRTRDETVIGDPGFDETALVWGDEAVLRALLDAPTRAAAAAVLEYSEAEVSGGTVQLTDHTIRLDLDGVREMLDEAADLADRIRRDAFSEDRLLEVATEDPEPGVRARALLSLWRCGTLETLDLAQDAARAHTDPVLRALGALMSEDPDRIANVPPPHMAEAARIGPNLVVATLERLGAEDALFDLLDEEHAPVQRAAAAALGRMGSIRAVEPLLPLCEGLTRDAELKREAREAVQRIQARLGDVSPGGLSLADGAAEAGQVSVAGVPGMISFSKN